MSSIEINNTIKTLKKGGVIVYPTDTVWGIGCDATNYNAVQKIFKIKKRNKSKAMICLVNDINMLKQYVEYIAGKRMHAVGQEKIFNTGTNPLPWTQSWITGGEVQVAPQETEITSYIQGGVKQDVSEDTFGGMTL